MTPAAEVPVRDAATVVLLRDGTDGTDGVEAWLLTRVLQMAFAGGMTVFPGGRVDAADAQLPVIGADVASLAGRFGCDESLATALLGAAVRETFEETGVLLAVPVAAGPAPAQDELTGRRHDVETGGLPFGQLLREHGLAVDGTALRAWGRWVTPAGEHRRYDTRFFVGALPDGAQALDVTSESAAASWLPVAEAIEQARRGERMLLPPTSVTLASLLPYRSVAEVLDAAAIRRLDPVEPVMRVADDGALWADLPDGSTLPVPRIGPA